MTGDSISATYKLRQFIYLIRNVLPVNCISYDL